MTDLKENTSVSPLRWKPDWPEVRDRIARWWKHDGMVLQILAPADRPVEIIEPPEPPATLEQRWLDPVYRARQGAYALSRTFLGGDAIPYLDLHLGPGNLATFLGSEPGFMPDTVWYKPCMEDLETHPPLRFDPSNERFLQQMAIIQEGLRISDGRFLIAMPDLIENLDTLSSLRGCDQIIFDMIDQPAAVKRRLDEILQVYFQAFDAIYPHIRDDLGGHAVSAFYLWGPGKTAKVQCDASAMMSPDLFVEFAIPPLKRQCQWLDWSMFHLDGTQCIQYLDQLLAIDDLDAIQWTPQAGVEPSGHPRWYPLYRKVLDAGKSMQALVVEAQYVLPLLENVGGRNMYIGALADSETEAREILKAAEAYRTS